MENVKRALFIRGTSTSETVNAAMSDLYSLKKPDAIFFGKRNALHPFDGGKDETSLEFFSHRNDASLVVLGSHSKKRPHNLTLVRMFDSHILDMFELSILGLASIGQIKGETCGVGVKPCILFNGEAWEQNPTLKALQSFLLDFFRGEVVEEINLAGLESVISLTTDGQTVWLRVYKIHLKRSGTRIPRIEVSTMGPSLDLRLGRTRLASEAHLKEAMRVPKELKPAKVKNVTTTPLGETVGRVHMDKQDLDKLQTRKVKALKEPKSKKSKKSPKEEEEQ